MQILKVLGLLTILLTGGPGFAFANQEAIHYEEVPTGTSQVTEDIQDLGESRLTANPNSLNFHQFQALHIPDFGLRSSHNALLAKIYLSTSASIDPTLDVQEIIFPFHTFL